MDVVLLPVAFGEVLIGLERLIIEDRAGISVAEGVPAGAEVKRVLDVL